MGFKQVAEVQFDLMSFKKALYQWPDEYMESRFKKPLNPYTKYVNELIDESKQLVSDLLKGRAIEERNRNLKYTERFRLTVTKGFDSHCGLVVDVKQPIAAIQTNNGVHWLKINQLYPAGLAPCKFVNGNYVDYQL